MISKLWNRPACWLIVLVAGSLVSYAASGSDRETLFLYAPPGPAPAIREAAVAFESMRGVHIEVVTGRTESWIERAAANADLVYSGAEYSMTSFIRNQELGLDRCTITSLYLRSPVVYVRPDNPHQIKEFEDLVQPGLRVMIVNENGAAGVWEDMAAKLGNIDTLRALLGNVTVFATDSDEAVDHWKKSPEIDAWVTWDTWFMPLRDQATAIRINDEHRMDQQSSVALTARGTAKRHAQEFIDYLVSEQGAEVFDSWGWITRDCGPRCLAVGRGICAVCRIEQDIWENGVGQGLLQLKTLVEDYQSVCVNPADVHICAVFCGKASYWLLNDGAYSRTAANGEENPNKELVRGLTDVGVSIELSSRVMKTNGWTPNDLLPEVKIVGGTGPRIVDLQLQGFAYLQL